MLASRFSIPEKQIRVFCERYHIRELALFGSALREDFDADSDIDLVVEFESDAQVGYLALSKMQRELSELFQRSVDLVPKGGLHPLLHEEIMNNIRVIYASGNIIPG